MFPPRLQAGGIDETYNIAFTPKAISVDNPTNFFVYFPQLQQWINPYTIGVIVPWTAGQPNELIQVQTNQFPDWYPQATNYFNGFFQGLFSNLEPYNYIGKARITFLDSPTQVNAGYSIGQLSDISLGSVNVNAGGSPGGMSNTQNIVLPPLTRTVVVSSLLGSFSNNNLQIVGHDSQITYVNLNGNAANPNKQVIIAPLTDTSLDVTVGCRAGSSATVKLKGILFPAANVATYAQAAVGNDILQGGFIEDATTGSRLSIANGSLSAITNNPAAIQALPSAARTLAQGYGVDSNVAMRFQDARLIGLMVFLVVTVASGTGGLTFKLFIIDGVTFPNNGVQIFHATTPVIQAGAYAYLIHPDASDLGDFTGKLAAHVGPNIGFQIGIGDASSYTYQLDYQPLYS